MTFVRVGEGDGVSLNSTSDDICIRRGGGDIRGEKDARGVDRYVLYSS